MMHLLVNILKSLIITSERVVTLSSFRVGDPFQIASNLLPNEEVSIYE